MRHALAAAGSGAVSALFSALSLAIAAFARSSKEGQYYLMPLLDDFAAADDASGVADGRA